MLKLQKYLCKSRRTQSNETRRWLGKSTMEMHFPFGKSKRWLAESESRRPRNINN